MQYKSAKKFWRQCLELVTVGAAGDYIENIAVIFTADAKAGKYDSLTEEEYYSLLADVEELAKLWNNLPRMTAGELLLNAMEQTAIPPQQLRPLVRLLAKCLAKSGQDDNFRIEDVPDYDAAAMLADAFSPRPPAKIRDDIARCVLGQTEAVKAAAMITYNHLAGRRTNAVFAGPSGCGKSEIWRVIAKAYPGFVRMVDFSRFTADGWKGSLHLRDIFDGVTPEAIKRQGLIVVMDEADKVVCEHAVRSGGIDHNAISQNSLLKMMDDGDRLEFGAEDGRSKLSVDCSKISVVLLGAFEKLLEDKSGNARHIGFGAAPGDEAKRHRDISYDDLINAGMRLEVAGRINKIVALDPLSVDDYKSILKGPVLSGLQQSLGCRIHMDGAIAGILAEQAAATGLGVRWMRSQVQNAIDDAMFDVPDTKEWAITMRDGGLCCRARKPREAAPIGSRAANTVPDRLMSA